MSIVRQQLICPFCKTVVAETPVPFMGDRAELEKATRDHLISAHPIRWRLHRRFRRAMRVSLQGQPMLDRRTMEKRLIMRALQERQRVDRQMFLRKTQ